MGCRHVGAALNCIIYRIQLILTSFNPTDGESRSTRPISLAQMEMQAMNSPTPHSEHTHYHFHFPSLPTALHLRPRNAESDDIERQAGMPNPPPSYGQVQPPKYSASPLEPSTVDQNSSNDGQRGEGHAASVPLPSPVPNQQPEHSPPHQSEMQENTDTHTVAQQSLPDQQEEQGEEEDFIHPEERRRQERDQATEAAASNQSATSAPGPHR